MSLHRTKDHPQWELTKPSERNVSQKVAAATGGIVTPGNVVTLIGLLAVFSGLWLLLGGRPVVGLLVITVGRLLDIVDGMVAEFTKTKSPLGELFDAAADKIGTFLTIFIFIVLGAASELTLALLLFPQLLILLIVFFKRRKNVRIHPTRSGKVSMALVWGVIFTMGLTLLIGEQAWLTITTNTFATLSVVLGLHACWQYIAGKAQDQELK